MQKEKEKKTCYSQNCFLLIRIYVYISACVFVYQLYASNASLVYKGQFQCIYVYIYIFFTFSHFCRLSAFPLQSKINDETFVLWRITVNMFVNSVKKKIIKKNSAVNVSSPSESVTRHVVYETQNTAFLAAYRDSSAALARTRESWILTP